MRLRDLKGLGPKTEKQLIAIGIRTPDELAEVGALDAFIRLRERAGVNPSINFLYAMIGALEDRSWLDIAQSERESILMSLEGYDELEKVLRSEEFEFKR